MIHFRAFSILFGMFIILTGLFACSPLQRHSIEKKQYDLNIFPMGDRTEPIRALGNLLVRQFLIDAAFDSHSFVYQTKEDEYKTDYYTEFVSYPARLITEKIEESLFASALFVPVNSSSKQNIDFRLSGKITKLYIDIRHPEKIKATIGMQILLEKQKNHTFKTVLNRTYISEISTVSNDPADLVSGWSRGLDSIIHRFLTDASRSVEQIN